MGGSDGGQHATTAPSALPPIRLPGITYPAPAEARTEPPAPALKPNRGLPPFLAPGCGRSPTPPHALGRLAVVNGRDITVATVTVVAETETVRHDEPLAPNAQAVSEAASDEGLHRHRPSRVRGWRGLGHRHNRRVQGQAGALDRIGRCSRPAAAPASHVEGPHSEAAVDGCLLPSRHGWR